jgi:hypothetical protein
MPFDGRGYYYRSRRRDGRPRREYVGRAADPMIRAAAELDAAEREDRRLAALELHQLRAELSALDAPVSDLDVLADLAARAALEALGMHRHKGEWRRRRERADDGGGGANP